ncbi:MAG: WD40 repeat domain-containing protein [Ilumatobacteraceae bacterium]
MTGADGRSRIISGSHDGTVRVWDPLTGQMLAGLRLGSAAASLAVVPGTDRFVAGVDQWWALLRYDEDPPHLDRV